MRFVSSNEAPESHNSRGPPLVRCDLKPGIPSPAVEEEQPAPVGTQPNSMAEATASAAREGRSGRGPPPPIPYHTKPVMHAPGVTVQGQLEPSMGMGTHSTWTNESAFTVLSSLSDDSNNTTDLSVLLSTLTLSDTVRNTDAPSSGDFQTSSPYTHRPDASSPSGRVPFSSPSHGLFQNSDTSQSIPAHLLASSSKKSKKKNRYYCVTRGRAIGVFDNWPLTKSYVTGIDACFKGYPTKEEAMRAFNECRELGTLGIID